MQLSNLCNSYRKRLAWVAALWFLGALSLQIFPELQMEIGDSAIEQRLLLLAFTPLVDAMALTWAFLDPKITNVMWLGSVFAAFAILSFCGIFFARSHLFFPVVAILFTLILASSIASVSFFAWINQCG